MDIHNIISGKNNGITARLTRPLLRFASLFYLLAIKGRNFVIPDDIKALAIPTLRHRVILSPSAEIEGLSADRVLSEILDQTAAPR